MFLRRSLFHEHLLVFLEIGKNFYLSWENSLRRKSISSVPVHPEISTDIWGQMAS